MFNPEPHETVTHKGKAPTCRELLVFAVGSSGGGNIMKDAQTKVSIQCPEIKFLLPVKLYVSG